MTEKFDAFFKAKREHTIKEIIDAQKSMNDKYQEVMNFLTKRMDYLPWRKNDVSSIENDDYILYPSGCIQSKRTGNYLLNDLVIYKITEVGGEKCIMLRKIELYRIDPNRIDFDYEHDQELFNTWYSQVESILTTALKR